MTAPRRILIITRNLPPLVGGMERLNWHMAGQLARCAEVRVIGPRGSASMAPAGMPVREAPLKPLWKFLLSARTLARREARAWKPDIVLAGSGLTAPLARSAARVCGAKTAVYVHGLDVAVKHPAYRAIWLPALRRMDRVIANSRATAALCRGSGIDPARIGIVHPGVDLPPSQAKREDFHPLPQDGDRAQRGEMSSRVTIPLAALRARSLSLRPSQAKGEENSPPSVGRGSPRSGGGMSSRVAQGDALPPARTPADFRTRHNLANHPLLLSVGRLSARKGLREFVTNALPRIVAEHPDVMLLIVGDAPRDALHAQAQTPDSIRAAAAHAGVAGNLRFLGTITDYHELGNIYRAADVHVFPVREIPGDPEGFGMVAVEAAAHGLPTVAFATGGVPDAVIEGETGSLIQPGDYAAFATCVNAWLARADRAEIAARCTGAASAFSWNHFGERLRELLDAVQRP